MITAENTYTREYLEANRNYYITSKAFKNYKQLLIVKIIAEIAFLIWILATFPQKSVFALINYIAAFYLAARIIACLVEMWNVLFSKKSLTPDKFRRRFIFSDDSFGLISQSENFSAERYKRYASIHSAVEWGDWFFICFNSSEVCIVKNSDLTVGTVDELRLLLKDKLGSRFKQ
ncbi:MAG: hypothetical protein J6B75_10605 [Ruminococcus sp.]|nr:hypothetical protein [Ruminococcus sp.]